MYDTLTCPPAVAGTLVIARREPVDVTPVSECFVSLLIDEYFSLRLSDAKVVSFEVMFELREMRRGIMAEEGVVK